MAFILYFVIKVQSIRNMTMNWLSKNTISMMLFFERNGVKMHDLAEKPVFTKQKPSNYRFFSCFQIRLKEKCPL
jgi:hypothetical protein